MLIDPDKDTAKDIADNIAKQLAEYRDCIYYHREKLMYYMPIRLMNMIFRQVIRAKHGAGLYPFSAIITNLTKIDITQYRGGGFTADTWFGFPVNQQLIPMFITLTGQQGASDITLGLPYNMATNGRLDSLMDTIVNGLKPS
jgi:hypothetical protein